MVELHDCFAHNELITYEALGLCPEGGADKFIRDGDNTCGGKVVTNPSGGLLSKGHPLGATGLAQCFELTHQLRAAGGGCARGPAAQPGPGRRLRGHHVPFGVNLTFSRMNPELEGFRDAVRRFVASEIAPHQRRWREPAAPGPSPGRDQDRGDSGAHLHRPLRRRPDRPRIDTVQASMAKYWISDLQCKVVDQCVQLFGGYGYMLEYPIAQMYVDARVQRIYGGANEIMKEIPDGRDALAEQKARFAALFATRSRDEWCGLLEGTDACFAPGCSTRPRRRSIRTMPRAAPLSTSPA